MLADAVLSQMIDQFVPCDSVQPGRERQRPVVARALPVNRDQRLLHQILQVRAISARTAREVDPQTLCNRSEEHTSELKSLMRNSYAVFCLTKNINIRIEYASTLLYTSPTTSTYPKYN